MKIPTKPITIVSVSNKRRRARNAVFDSIPCVDVINHTGNDGMVRERKIRYIPGSGSIFADEQPEYMDNDWERKNMRPRSIQIVNGEKHVDPSETLLLNYLNLCNYNRTNPTRKKSIEPLFEVYDPEAISRKKNEERALRIDSAVKIKEMDKNQLKAHLITMTEGTAANLIRFQNMEEEELRGTAYDLAEKDPIKFMKSFEEPSTAAKYIVINAILRGYIHYNDNTKMLTYQNGDVVMNPANGMNGIDALAQLSITSEHHKNIVNDLRAKMSGEMSSKEKKATEVPEIKEDNKDMYDTLIDKCLDKEIISVKGQWHTINNESKDSTEDPFKVMGRRALKDELKTNPERFINLIQRVEK